MLDYIIVGLGLSGISFSETAEKNHKTFKVIADESQVASQVAAGLYNPVILKRFTLAWNAKEQLEAALPFYQKLEEKLKIKLDYKLAVRRRFASVEEQNLWFEASDKPGLNYFLSPKIHQNTNSNVDAPFGFGEVLHTGRIDTATLLTTYKAYLIKQKVLAEESFEYEAFHVENEYVEYKGIRAKQIVFCEGFGLKQNPYFNYLPLTGTKGEYLLIEASELQEEIALKANIFCIPEGNNIYRVGATYKWRDYTNIPTEATKEELKEKLKSFIKCDYKIVGHVAGVRPTVTDRKPLVGQHPEEKNVFVLNGFGSRGVLIAPSAAKQLFDLMENDTALLSEIDIVRFEKKYTKN